MRMRLFALFVSFFSSTLLAVPSQVIIIRHGEKPEKGHDLSLQGEQRAEALVSFFQTNPRMLTFGLPAAVFASLPSDEDPSQREIETITPFASAVGLPVLSPYSSTDGAELAKLIKNNPTYAEKMVLICWEHSVMGDLASFLGVEPMPPPYPGDRFDLVYMITYNKKSSNPSFCIGLQNLMPDDSPVSPPDFTACNP